MKSMKKHLNKPFKNGFIDFMVSKIKLIWIPVAIAIPFNIAYSILTKGNINIWGFLWYIKQMLIYFAVCFTLRYFIKDEKKFFIIIALMAILATILNIFPIFYEMGEIRAFMGISLGILASYLPPLKIKKNGLIWLILIPIQITILSILIFGNNLFIEKLLHLFLYPSLIYLTFQLDINNNLFNYLGSLSFGLYSFQCVVRPLPLFGLENVWVLFSIIVLLTILENALKKHLAHKKSKNLITT